MKHKIFIKSILVIAFFCCVLQSCKTAKTEQYIGIDECTSAEIRLTLNPDQTFVLTKQLKDNKSKSHEKQAIIKGNWVKDGKLLKLYIIGENVIVYEQTTENSVIAGHEFNVETYVFKTNLRNFFASKIDLNLDVTN